MWQSLCYYSCLIVPPLPLICATDIPPTKYSALPMNFSVTTLKTLHFTYLKQVRTGLPVQEGAGYVSRCKHKIPTYSSLSTGRTDELVLPPPQNVLIFSLRASTNLVRAE